MTTNATSSVHPPVETVHDDSLIRAWFVPGRSERLIVSFSGVGKDDQDVQPPEFIGSANRDGENPSLFIADRQRSWLNAPGMIEAIVALIERTKAGIRAERVSMVGNSMGGFMAMVMPAFTKVETALAFAPQFSVIPEVAGETRRWRHWRDRIVSYRIADISDHVVPATRYFAVHGDRRREEPHRQPIESLPLVSSFVMQDAGHDVAARLRRRGVLSDTVTAALDNRPRRLRLILKSAGCLASRFHNPEDASGRIRQKEIRNDQV